MKIKIFFAMLIASVLVIVAFLSGNKLRVDQSIELNSSQNLELLSSYSRLHLMLLSDRKIRENKERLLQENSELQRLYIQSEIMPACLDEPIATRKVLCRVKYVSQPSGLNSKFDVIKIALNERLMIDSQNCKVDISANSCAKFLSYNLGENLTPQFKKIDEELEVK